MPLNCRANRKSGEVYTNPFGEAKVWTGTFLFKSPPVSLGNNRIYRQVPEAGIQNWSIYWIPARGK